jgi:hypothetical protein
VSDVSAWTAQYPTTDYMGNLVDRLNTLLLGGQLSADARNLIVQYLSDSDAFPSDSPPTEAQMSARVLAAIQLVIVSPDFVIQK